MGLTEEDRNLLRSSARASLQAEAPVSALRALRENSPERGFDERLWLHMAAQGWLGVLIDEQYDGLQLGFSGAAILCEEMGRQLAASPFTSTSVMAPIALQAGVPDGSRQELLERMATGEAIVAIAIDEGRHHDPSKLALTAVPAEGGWHVSGLKSFVADGSGADSYLVTARYGAEDLLLLIDARAENLSVEKLAIADSRAAVKLEFRQVFCAGNNTIARGEDSGLIVGRILDGGRLALSAELLGIAEETLARTVDYLKQRRQFGHLLASYQALQHRMSILYCEIEVLRSLVRAAADAADENLANAAGLVSATKAKAIQVGRLAVSEAVQLHGGIGMTDELDIGLFMKRVRVAAENLGNEYFHLDRFAVLRGF